MFYVKKDRKDARSMTVELTDENVFCICPKCGVEVQVDLVAVLQEKDSDLFGTNVYCAQCSRKYKEELTHG